VSALWLHIWQNTFPRQELFLHKKEIYNIGMQLRKNATTNQAISSDQSNEMKQADINLAEALVPFGGSATSVDTPDKAILGGKGLGLQEMSRIGVDVPPGFTLITPLCIVYEKQNDLPAEMWVMVKQAIKRVEADTGKKFGADENPLLFSCRSGAAISMPGMMDTVLNIVGQLKRHVFDNSDPSLIFSICFLSY
jgi:hypothetical protein